jgi:MOSC domain-containing protein YiiM
MTSIPATQASPAVVSSVNSAPAHDFTKQSRDTITLLEGLGVEGDAHVGTTVQHRSRVAIDPTAPNLRQVHLIHSELFTEVADAGFTVRPGDLGENVTTTGIDLLGLPRGTILELGDDAQVQITGLRNPCVQIDSFRRGLLKTMVGRDPEGRVIRKAGVMGVVLSAGVVHPGDRIIVRLPPDPHEALERV